MSPYEVKINEVPTVIKVALNVSWDIEKVQVPTDVVLALDSSGSMSQTDPTDERKRASKSFVDLMKEGDLTKYRVGVGSWDYKIDFTDYDVGLQAAINILDTNPRNGTRIIIFLTDGWVDTYNRSLANEAASKGYKIYTIGMGLKAPADIYLKEIASFTNGEYKSVPTPSDLGDIYTDIAEEVLYTSAVRDIAVTEVLQHYFWVKDGTFTIQPDKITQNLDGTTTIVWHIKDLTKGLWEASFDVIFNLEFPVDVMETTKEISKVTYTDPEEKVRDVLIPRGKILVKSSFLPTQFLTSTSTSQSMAIPGF